MGWPAPGHTHATAAVARSSRLPTNCTGPAMAASAAAPAAAASAPDRAGCPTFLNITNHM